MRGYADVEGIEVGSKQPTSMARWDIEGVGWDRLQFVTDMTTCPSHDFGQVPATYSCGRNIQNRSSTLRPKFFNNCLLDQPRFIDPFLVPPWRCVPFVYHLIVQFECNLMCTFEPSDIGVVNNLG